jgi:SAM-dependent methyltransferase
MKAIAKNYTGSFNIIDENLQKWTTLPAGKKRESVITLTSLSEENLITFYKECANFWESERGWEHKRYSGFFAGKSVLEIGSGLGYDGIVFSQFVKKWTFSDIIRQNIQFIQKISNYYNLTNVDFQIIENIFEHNFKTSFDAFYAHGVLHHVPFEIAKQEVKNIDRFLLKGAKIVVLMYPYERWELCGKPSFEEFGVMTDGPNTPWAEYYDEKKIINLFGPNYNLDNIIKWGHEQKEFVNFELTKIKT